jgi:hypothetical protein
MSDEWSPDSILTNEKFTENNVVEIREIFDMIDIRFSFEVKAMIDSIMISSDIVTFPHLRNTVNIL